MGQVSMAVVTRCAPWLLLGCAAIACTDAGDEGQSGASEAPAPRSVEEQAKAEETRAVGPDDRPAALARGDGPEDKRDESGAQSQTSAGDDKPGAPNPGALLDPAQATQTAPDEFSVKFETTKGDFIVDVKRAWAPLGADRFYNLVRIGYYTDVAFFRVVSNFMAQVGIHGDPQVNAAWRKQSIQDDPVRQSNKRGTVTFATAGKDSRVNQFFINFVDNSRLDGMGFAPFGKVRDMTPVDKLYAGYGEGPPRGRGPMQRLIETRGNAYLRADFPEMDYIKSATIVP